MQNDFSLKGPTAIKKRRLRFWKPFKLLSKEAPIVPKQTTAHSLLMNYSELGITDRVWLTHSLGVSRWFGSLAPSDWSCERHTNVLLNCNWSLNRNRADDSKAQILNKYSCRMHKIMFLVDEYPYRTLRDQQLLVLSAHLNRSPQCKIKLVSPTK